METSDAGPATRTYRPDLFNLSAGLVFFGVFGIAALGYGCASAVMVSDAVTDWKVWLALVPLLLSALAFIYVLAQCANLSAFKVVLRPDSVSYRDFLRTYTIRADQIDQIYFVQNFRYIHVLVRQGSDLFDIASLLWSNKLFLKFWADMDAWAQSAGVAVHTQIDFKDPSLNPPQWSLRKAFLKGFRRDIWFYAALFYAPSVVISLVRLALLGLFHRPH